ncbi:MAG: TIGR03936 family radical SAM-associated protein [Anaerolineales bacterium]
MRYRMTFSKTEAMRFTSHLDLHTTLERTMRRANLPLVYSQGFTPRPKLSLASALPLGYTSEAEAAEFWLEEELPVEEVAKAIHHSAPPGIQLHEVRIADEQEPKLQNALSSAEFVISLRQPDPDLPRRVAEMMAAEELPRERIRKGKKKTYDLRSLILAAEVTPPDGDSPQQLKLHLRAEPGATGRPDEVLDELGIDPLSPHIHRTKLVF